MIHAIERAAERYGLTLSPHELWALSQQIVARENAVLLRRHLDGRERWALWHKGEWLPVIFAPETQVIVTVLPAEALRQFKKKLPW